MQPVLDKYCVGCHDGQPRDDGQALVDLRGEQGAYVCLPRRRSRSRSVVRDAPLEKLVGKYGGIFEPSYVALRSLVRVGGLESDLHLLPPMEFHADTSELVQMLRKGHHGVQLDAEAWDRLVTWIDLNAPCHGTWSEFVRISGDQRERRCELRKLYGGVVEDRRGVPDCRPGQAGRAGRAPSPPQARARAGQLVAAGRSTPPRPSGARQAAAATGDAHASTWAAA